MDGQRERVESNSPDRDEAAGAGECMDAGLVGSTSAEHYREMVVDP